MSDRSGNPGGIPAPSGLRTFGGVGPRPPFLLFPLLALPRLAVGRLAAEGHAHLACHRRHHLAGLEEPLDKLIDLTDRDTRSVGDTQPTRSVDDFRIGTLGGRHAADDRLQTVERLVVDGRQRVLHLARAGQHAQQVADGPHLADRQHLLEEVLQRQLAAADLRGRFLGPFGVEHLLGLLDEREHVAHAQDAARHPVRVEDVEVLELLTARREQDRHAGDLSHRQCGTTAGIAVELGQHHTGEADALTERLGGGHGVLADHRVEHEDHFVGIDGVADRGGLAHQLVVDAEPARGVDDDDVEVLGLGLGEAGSRHRDGITGCRIVGPFNGPCVGGEDLDTGPLADDLELVDGTGTLQVAGNEQRRIPLILKPFRELSGKRRLTRPCRPASMITVGGVLENASWRVSPPRMVISSSLTILTTCWAGFSAPDTSAPLARSLMRATKSRTTGNDTSASSSANRISRVVASMSASDNRPLPRSPCRAPVNRSESDSNTRSSLTGL